jgi:hypothetical protein
MHSIHPWVTEVERWPDIVIMRVPKPQTKNIRCSSAAEAPANHDTARYISGGLHNLPADVNEGKSDIIPTLRKGLPYTSTGRVIGENYNSHDAHKVIMISLAGSNAGTPASMHVIHLVAPLVSS